MIKYFHLWLGEIFSCGAVLTWCMIVWWKTEILCVVVIVTSWYSPDSPHSTVRGVMPSNYLILHSLIYCTLHEYIISTKIYVWIILFTPPPLLARNVCNETFLKLNNIFGQFGIFIQWHEITNNNVDAELMLSHCLNFLQLTKQWKQCIWYENKEVVSSVSSYLQVSLLSLCSEWRYFRS